MAVTDDGLGPSPGEPDPNEWPRGERARRRVPVLLKAIRDDMSLLGRQQLELGKQEMKEIASEKAVGAGLLTAGAVLALFMLGFMAFAGAEALALTLPRWASFLIIAGIFLILAVIAFFAGREALQRPAAPERTKQTVKEDVEWAKRQLKR
jgi:Putative Actinobacterial Holin-X, holin superfamily III